jgi:hypothetical protein
MTENSLQLSVISSQFSDENGQDGKPLLLSWSRH